MSIRNISALVACAATLAVSSTAMSQDTTRTRDSLTRLQMQPPAIMMTVQERDLLITQLTDSANRAANPMIAQQWHDSVIVLRALVLRGDTLNMRMPMDTSMMTPQQRAQQRNMQQNMPQNMQQNAEPMYQQRQATSDQRLRVQKDWQNNNDPTGTYPPAAGSRP